MAILSMEFTILDLSRTERHDKKKVIYEWSSDAGLA